MLAEYIEEISAQIIGVDRVVGLLLRVLFVLLLGVCFLGVLSW